jgi:ribosome recycling factor
MEAIKKLQKDSDISEDDAKRYEKDIQDETDLSINQINSNLSEKEKELTTV